jgi:hypothetical protein
MNKDRINNLPRARKDQLITKELPDETLVYDLSSDKAHCLNQTAALVWKNCDGKKTVREINASLAAEAGAPIDERVVWLALDQLEKFKLLAEVPATPVVFQGLNRRQLIRALGVAATLPVIMTIAAPTRAQVGSGAAPGACCTTNSNCQSGNCQNGGTCPPPSKICV